MANNIEKEIRNISKLKLLCDCDKKTKKKTLSKADKELIEVLRDCILNVLDGNIPLSEADKTKLNKHKYTLRKIVNTKQTYKNRNLLVQKGGSFLPIILPGAISLISTIIDLINAK
jgi:hypothetical protein